MEPIAIESESDWAQLGRDAVITDPMILRYGEMFLAGRRAAGEDANRRWRAIAADIGGLMLFFDQIVLRERIPMFNYGDTFDARLNLGQRVLADVNRLEPILYEVDVRWAPYQQAKACALEEAREVLGPKLRLSPEDLREVVRHLSALEYDWNPSIEALGVKGSRAKRVAAFLVGGMIFSAYAQQSGAGHLLQPRRASLFTGLALGVSPQAADFDRRAFAELNRTVRDLDGTVQRLPSLSFVPLLLSQGDSGETPDRLLGRALALRHEPAIVEYRAMYHEAYSEWSREGRIPDPTRRKLSYMRGVVARSLHVEPQDLGSFRLDVVRLGSGGLPVDAGLDVPKGAARLRGWLFVGLPMRGVTKLLVRAAREERNYTDVANALRTRWGNA